jgi:hypothetical protein
MSAELVHLSCWFMLAAMALFLVVGGIRTFRDYRDVLRERRARRKAVQGGVRFRPATFSLGAA